MVVRMAEGSSPRGPWLGRVLGRVRLLVLGGVAAYTAIPSCATTANVTDMYTALDEDGFRRRTLFYTDSKKIYCVGELGVGRDDVTFEIYLRQTAVLNEETGKYEDANLSLLRLEFAPKRSQSLVKQVMTLSPKNPKTGQDDQNAPFPVGKFLCEAWLDGKLERTAAFSIDFAPCPEVVIAPGSPCKDFFGTDPDRKCKVAGATGERRTGECVCENAGWKCTGPE